MDQASQSSACWLACFTFYHKLLHPRAVAPATSCHCCCFFLSLSLSLPLSLFLSLFRCLTFQRRPFVRSGDLDLTPCLHTTISRKPEVSTREMHTSRQASVSETNNPNTKLRTQILCKARPTHPYPPLPSSLPPHPTDQRKQVTERAREKTTLKFASGP